MDLPYPTQKDQQLRSHLAIGTRKPSLVLKDSLRNIPALPPLPPAIKKNIANLLRNDYPYELKEIIEKEVVSLRVEVGREGSEDNLLHVACRQNAEHCVQYLLKRYYTFFPNEYEFWVNLGNKERMTPAMVCSLSGANESLKMLLDHGGIDIHLIDSNKLSAYQIALAAKNQTAVRMLMQYQGSKKAQKIDKEKLNQEVQLLPSKISLCDSLYRCLIDCFRGKIQEDEHEEKLKKVRSKRTGSMLDVVSGGIESYFKDRVDIGYSKDVIKSDEIQWRSLGDYQQMGSSGTLFDTFSPFDMEDISFPMETVLICLQSLSQHPWLVRRVIQPDKAKSSHYLVTIYPKHQSKTLSIDGNLPFNTNNNQPLFIADKKEGWPMLVQKSLARHYGSYKSLSEVQQGDLMETLTGWPVVRHEISNGPDTMQLLQKITSLGYMFVLEGRDHSYLSCPKKHNCTFTVLTFYTKGDKRLVLINCPFVDPAWVEKERHQILALKILRGHYNCRQQMTIWVEEERLKEYFSHVIIAPIKTGHHRFSLPLDAIEWLYFRVEIGQTQEQPVIIHLIDSAKGVLVDISKTQGWINEKEKVKILPPEKCREKMVEFQGKAGQYLFRVKVPKGKYQLVGWTSDQIKLEAVEESFGELEWIACLKKSLSINWKEEPCAIYNTGQYTLMMKKSDGECWASGFGSVQVIEGKKGGQGIEMLHFDDGYRFCVVRGTIRSANFYEA